jgi:hypothetical protein
VEIALVPRNLHQLCEGGVRFVWSPPPGGALLQEEGVEDCKPPPLKDKNLREVGGQIVSKVRARTPWRQGNWRDDFEDGRRRRRRRRWWRRRRFGRRHVTSNVLFCLSVVPLCSNISNITNITI